MKEDINNNERPCGSKTPEDKIYRYEFKNLENKIISLEKAVNILTILCNEYAKRNRIKVEKYPNGVVVIS